MAARDPSYGPDSASVAREDLQDPIHDSGSMNEPGEGSIDAELQVPVGGDPDLSDDADFPAASQLDPDEGDVEVLLVDPDVLDQLPAE